MTIRVAKGEGLRVLVTGAHGQLGRELVRTAPAEYEVSALSRVDCDITDANAVFSLVGDYKPDVILNAAAYTAVDRAESERDAAFAVNALGPKNLAGAAKKVEAILVHVSTDYVFDGLRSAAYTPECKTRPLSVYGASKELGEREVIESGVDALVIRTSWLYSSNGNNFLSTILRLLKTREALRVVDDQIGTPTAAGDLAAAIWACVKSPDARGVMHWTNAGLASWYDFAVAIQELALERSIVTSQKPIIPIRTSEYPLAAARPRYSVLDSRLTWALAGQIPLHWREALGRTLDQVRPEDNLPPSTSAESTVKL